MKSWSPFLCNASLPLTPRQREVSGFSRQRIRRCVNGVIRGSLRHPDYNLFGLTLRHLRKPRPAQAVAGLDLRPVAARGHRDLEATTRLRQTPVRQTPLRRQLRDRLRPAALEERRTIKPDLPSVPVPCTDLYGAGKPTTGLPRGRSAT